MFLTRNIKIHFFKSTFGKGGTKVLFSFFKREVEQNWGLGDGLRPTLREALVPWEPPFL